MKLTKYEHACLMLDSDQSRLVIDPGCFTKLPDDLSGIGCIVITEEHVDHFNLENIQKILEQSPGAKIFSTDVVVGELAKSGIEATAIHGEQEVDQSGYHLSFYETPHAAVYRTSPCQSLSVKVDDYLYYPSDSYNTIDDTVEVLALPTSGPWHKLEEAIDLANTINSSTVLATHNWLYNEDGEMVANLYIKNNISDKNRNYVYLKPGESL